MMKLTFITLVFLLGPVAFAQDNSDGDVTPPTEIGKAFLKGEQQRLKVAEKQLDDATNKLKMDEKLYKKGHVDQSVLDSDSQSITQLKGAVALNQKAVNDTQEALDKTEDNLKQAQLDEQNAKFSAQQAKQAETEAKLQAKQDQNEINQKPANNNSHWWHHKDLPAQQTTQPVADSTTGSSDSNATAATN